MNLVLYRTTLAAPQLSSVFKVSPVVKMANRNIRSGAYGSSVNSRNNSMNNKQELGLWSEEEFPSLSAAKSMLNGKRRNRVDLVTRGEQSSEKEVKNPLKRESMTSIILENCTQLPTSFQKTNVSSPPRNQQPYQTHGDTKRVTCGEQSLDKEVKNPLKREAMTSIRHENYTQMPTSFQKTNVSSPHRHLLPHQIHGVAKGTRVDLGMPGKRSSEKRVHNTGPLKPKPMTLTSHENHTQLSTSFGKKRVHSPPRNRKVHQSNREGNGSSMSSRSMAINEPFDICFSETRETDFLNICGNEGNHGMLDQKMQSAEEDEPELHKDIAKENDNVLDSIEEIGEVLRPGMVLLKQYIPLSEQVDIVNRCRTLGCGPGGFYRPGFDDGPKLRLHMMCLGLDWNAQTKLYTDRRRHDNVPPPQIPNEFKELVCRALDDSHTLIKRDMKTKNVEDVLPSMSPDICIVNFYNTTGRLGLHQDRDESYESLEKGLPVVSISVGDSAEFLFGDGRDVDKATNVVLESGDVLIFGGESRHIFHGVKTIIPNTAPAALLESTRLKSGRLNLTFRRF